MPKERTARTISDYECDILRTAHSLLAPQIGHPRIANELAIAHQCRNLHVRKCRAHAIQKPAALRGVRVSRRWQRHPQERKAHTVPDHRNHQDVDRGLAEISDRAINHQNPRLAGTAQQFDHHAR